MDHDQNKVTWSLNFRVMTQKQMVTLVGLVPCFSHSVAINKVKNLNFREKKVAHFPREKERVFTLARMGKINDLQK